MIQNFTPVSATSGGALIGLAASLLLLAHGRVAGISGILGGILTRNEAVAWRVAFLAGLAVGGLAIAATFPATMSMAGSRPLPLLLVSGVLVGFGTRLGAGCTSGHGVCGLSRRSPRSLVAVVTFMATGFASATALHVVTR